MGGARGRSFRAFALLAVILGVSLVVAAVGCGGSSTTTTTVGSATTASESTTSTAAVSTTTTAGSNTSTTVAVGKLRIFWISPWYASLGTGKESNDVLFQYLRDKGWNVTVQDAHGNFQTVISDIESDIQQKPDAIIVARVSFHLAGTAYDEAYAAHIPVFVQNGDVTGKQVGAVSYDAINDQIRSTENFAKAINYTGNVVVVTQTDDFQIDEQSKAMLQVLAKYPDIRIIQNVKPDHKNDLDALKTIMTALLTSHPTPGSIAGGIAAWSDPAVGMAQAAEAAKRYEVKIVGFGASEAECQQMSLPQPVLIGAMYKPAQAQAVAMVDMIQGYFDGSNKAMGQNVLLPSIWIAPGPDAQAKMTYYEDYAARGFAALTTTTAP